MEKAVPGWWFAVVCPSCHQHIPFAVAPSPEEEPEAKSQGWEGTCPHCGEAHSFNTAAVERVLVEEDDE